VFSFGVCAGPFMAGPSRTKWRTYPGPLMTSGFGRYRRMTTAICPTRRKVGFQRPLRRFFTRAYAKRLRFGSL